MPNNQKKLRWPSIVRLALILVLALIGCLWIQSCMFRNGVSLSVEQVDTSKKYSTTNFATYSATEFAVTDEAGEIIFSRTNDTWAAPPDAVAYRASKWHKTEFYPAQLDQIKDLSELPIFLTRLGFVYAHHPDANLVWIMIPFWLPFLVATVVLLVVWRRIRKVTTLHDQAKCLTCSYDLRAHHPSSSCPECGTRMPPTISATVGPDQRSPQ